MKITPKILSIPPYLSTSWPQIHSIYKRDNELVVRLVDGATISIPDLKTQEIEAIFAAHSIFIETSHLGSSSTHEQQSPMHILHTKPHTNIASSPGQNIEGIPGMHLNFENMESFSSALQHNLEQAHMPNLPSEILNKIAAIAKIVAPTEIPNMPRPEPHCNCPHCQIARAIHGLPAEEKMGDAAPSLLPHKEEVVKEEEVIDDKDLSFQEWDITQTGENLYSVVSKLEPTEKYNVFLGNPVGCTCGNSGCEHILAVLKS